MKRKFACLAIGLLSLVWSFVPLTLAVTDSNSTTPSSTAKPTSSASAPVAGSEDKTLQSGAMTNDTNPFYQLGTKGFNPRPAAPAAFTIPAYTSVEMYVVSVINFILDFLGLIIIVMIVWGGMQYVLAMGDSGKIKKAKSVMTSAIVGFFLVIISFAIVATIVSAVRPGINECVNVQNGVCLSSGGNGLNFGIGTGIGRVIGSIF